jgi:hypothetical protein
MKRRLLGGRGKTAGALSAATALTMLVFASLALASSHHPTGEYEKFAECPLNRVTITDCVYSVTTSGSFKIGSKTVPIVNPVTLQGGFEGAGESIKFFGAENGDTLSKTPQPVPGGLLGLLNCKEVTNPVIKGLCAAALENGLTGANATVELAAPATSIKLNTLNLLLEEGTALSLPGKIHLENPLLGNKCYLGSESKPVNIDFTSGTSGSLVGDNGELSFNEEFTIITIAKSKLVNSTFVVPKSSGCGGLLSLVVGPVLDAVLGLPSESGNNSAALEGDLLDGQAPAVIESE